MLCFFRIAVSTLPELSKYRHRSDYSKPINGSNESKALYVMDDYLGKLLARYNKSYKATLADFKRAREASNRKMALKLIIGEMEIIIFYKLLAQQAMNYMNGSHQDILDEFRPYINKIDQVNGVKLTGGGGGAALLR